MKLLLAELASLFISIGSLQAQTLKPIPLTGEWDASNGFAFSPTCSAPHFLGHGTSCARFPSGGKLYGFQFQTSIKAGGIEALWFIVISTSGRFDSGMQIVAQNHHRSDTPVLSKPLALPIPIDIPPGAYVWIYSEASGVPVGAAVMEAQTTIYVDASTINMIAPTAAGKPPAPIAPPLPASPPPPTPSAPRPAGAQSPRGTFDGINNSTAYGWSFDPDVPAQSIKVECFDGQPGATNTIGTVTTDVDRSDVNQAFGISGAHGFQLSLPISLIGHAIYCVGNDATGNANVVLSGSPKVFNP